MIKVKCNTKNEALSISGEMNDDAVVAQSTFCLNSKKNCGVLRCFWQSSRENIRMSCIKSWIMSWIMSCIICIGIAIVIMVITGTIQMSIPRNSDPCEFFPAQGKKPPRLPARPWTPPPPLPIIQDSFNVTWFPVTSSNRHFIFWVTSYQREKWSLHTLHFIPVHYIPCGTSYQSHFIPVHFIPRPLHTSHFIPIVTPYQCTLYQGHFISVHFIPKSLHTEVISYQSHLIPSTSYRSHFIPESNQSLRTSALHTTALHTSHFMTVTLYQSLNRSAFHISALRTEFTLLSSYLIECTSD